MSRFSKILYAAQSGTFSDVFPPLSKADFFDAPVGKFTSIEMPTVMERIKNIVEMLANRGEFITSDEWHQKTYGSASNQSLSQLVPAVGAKKLSMKNGYLCTPASKAIVPSTPAPGYHRAVKLIAASEATNDAFWSNSYGIDADGVKSAATMWANLDINIEHRKAGIFSKEKYTPLMNAAAEPSKFTGMVRFFLDAGANPDAVSDRGYTPLIIAAAKGNDEAVRMLIEALQQRYANDPAKLSEALNRKTSDNDHTAMTWALMKCDASTVERLKNARVAAKTAEFTSPPTIQAEAGRAEARRADIMALLAPYGEKITREQLLAEKEGRPILRDAIVAGVLPRALDMLRASGERLSKDDWLAGNPDKAFCNLMLASAMNQLPVVFKPDYWVGHVSEMQELWKQVPLAHQSQMDGQDGRPSFRRNFQMANALSARSLGGGAGIGGGV